MQRFGVSVLANHKGECFGKSQSDLKSSDSYQLAAIMKQIGGWERTSTIRNLPIYGRQRIYKKRLNANTKHSKHN